MAHVCMRCGTWFQARSHATRHHLECLEKAHRALVQAIEQCLPDLDHYASTHGPGPDDRLAHLRSVLYP